MALRKVVEVISNSADQTIQLVMDSGRTVDIKVSLCKIALDPSNKKVYLYDSSQSQLANGSDIFEPNFYTLIYSEITNPVTANEVALYNAVLAMLAESFGGGGGGDATAANQVIQINELKRGSGEDSVFKNAFDQSVFMDPFNNGVFVDSNGSVFKDLASGESVFNDPTYGSWLRYLINLQAITTVGNVQIQRPNNVTPYTIGDAINDNVTKIMLLSGVAPRNGIANLVSITVASTSNVAVKPIFNYFFFSQQPNVQPDNVPINILDFQVFGTFIGSVSGSSMSTALSIPQSNSVQQLNIVDGLRMLTGSQDIYVVIGLANAYIPTAQEQFSWTFKFQN